MSSLIQATGAGVGVGVAVGDGVGVGVNVGVGATVGVGVGNTTVRELFISLLSTTTFVESAVALTEGQVHTGATYEQGIEGVRQVFAG